MCAGKKQQNKKQICHCRDRVHYAVSDTTPTLGGHPRRMGMCFACLSVVNSCRETPGPIPNPEAKPAHADGTATGRLWESKSPPTPNNKTQQNTETKRRRRQTTVSFFFTFCRSRRNPTPLRHTRSLTLDLVEVQTPRQGSNRQRTLNLCFYPRCRL